MDSLGNINRMTINGILGSKSKNEIRLDRPKTRRNTDDRKLRVRGFRKWRQKACCSDDQGQT